MAASMATRKFLFYFANEHVDFRIAELLSIISVFKFDVKIPECDVRNPFLVLDLPTEDHARKIASRAILIKSVYELWAHGKTHKQLHDKLRQLPSAFLAPHIRSKETFKFDVITFNRTLLMKDKVSKIENLPEEVFEFQGKVDLKNAQRIYGIFESYGSFGTASTEDPVDIYFGKWLADGQRDDIHKFDLKKRYFIANTSMDAGLSMIMANMGRVTRNMLVLDPFVGSGSLLVSVAHFGAYVLGTDLNYLLLHGKAKPSRVGMKKRKADESIRANLRQYGLEDQYLDVMIADASRGKMWREQTLFHAIITDPPYGVREKTKKVGTEEKDVSIDEELLETGRHIARKQDYHLSEMFKDLLNFSAKYLHKHGRLVYWFPVHVKSYTEANIPSHPCLRLVHNCEQPLNSQVSRRLITMEKVTDFCESLPGAEVQVDHFEELSFRDMYLSEEALLKERIPGLSKKQQLKGSGLNSQQKGNGQNLQQKGNGLNLQQKGNDHIHHKEDSKSQLGLNIKNHQEVDSLTQPELNSQNMHKGETQNQSGIHYDKKTEMNSQSKLEIKSQSGTKTDSQSQERNKVQKEENGDSQEKGT